MKKCNKCKVEKEMKAFARCRENLNGRSGICRQCEAEKDKIRREEKKYFRQFNII